MILYGISSVTNKQTVCIFFSPFEGTRGDKNQIFRTLQIPGFPYLRLYKPNGEQLDYFGNMHVDYPFPVAAMRNFVGETAFDEDIAHPCMTYPSM